MIDSRQIIYDYLSQIGSDLYDEVGTRIWTPVAPSSWKNETPAIVFNEASGAAHYSGATIRSLFNFKCFGGSSQRGNEITVYRYLYDLLHGASVTVASGEIISAAITSSIQLPPEPDSTFNSYLATFAITFANE